MQEQTDRIRNLELGIRNSDPVRNKLTVLWCRDERVCPRTKPLCHSRVFIAGLHSKN
jgi:hypothetical protein